jgi:hypothetical protein
MAFKAMALNYRMRRISANGKVPSQPAVFLFALNIPRIPDE